MASLLNSSSFFRPVRGDHYRKFRSEASSLFFPVIDMGSRTYQKNRFWGFTSFSLFSNLFNLFFNLFNLFFNLF